VNYLPKALDELIESLASLPGVGSRTAERYAYYLLRADNSIALRLAKALDNLHDNVGYCETTFALVPKGQKESRLYTDSSRDKKTIAVVAEPFDILALEKIGQYKGTYHVLGGLISPLDNISPDQLRLKELKLRVKKDQVTELIIATNASVEGESTALYIQKQFEKENLKISRLARGLPVGIDIEYADQITLGRALEGRTLL
jgi:recombination protein RecR